MKKLCMLLICISLFPFISSFGTLIGESNGNTTNLSYVPYFGATGNISVGIYNLTSGGLFPTTTLLYDIGTGANRWRWLYVQNISADSIDVVGNVTASGYLLGDGGFLTGVNVTDIWVDETGDTMTGALNIKNSLNIFGNYPFKFWDNGGVNQYSYMMGNADEFRFSAVGNQMNFYYGALGSNLASSMDTSGNWNFTKNVEIFGDLNVTSDTWCNQTNCYNFSDFLTGGGSGVLSDRWLNTSDYLYINSSYPQHINISGNATFGGGALFKGAILGDESLGYENIRFGVYSHTPRIILDNGSYIGQIDYVGDTIRFILNDSGTNRATMRINNSAVRIGEASHRKDLYLYGDLIGVDPAGGGANIKIDGKINITTDTWCNRDNCYNLSNFLGNSSFNGTFVSDNYVPYTGATSNVVLGDNNFSVNGSTLFVNKENGNVGIGTTSPQSLLHVYNNTSLAVPQETLRAQGIWAGAGSGPLLRFTNYHGSGDNPNSLEYNLAGIAGRDFAGNWAGGLVFMTPNSGDAGGSALVDRMVIREDGNVGIGTASPGERLTVLTTGTHTYMELDTDAVDKEAIYRVSDQGTAKWSFGKRTDDKFGIYGHTATAGWKLVIEENTGNVGIGTTNPGYKLEMAGTGTNAGIHLIKTDAVTASWYLHIGRLGTGEFSIGDDTAYRLVILPTSGNVGIGTTSPSEKLQIDGNFTSETNATDSIGTLAIQWLNGFFVDLFVSNDLEVGGDVNVTGYIGGKNYVTQYHRNAIIDTTSADTWVNISWDLTIDEETTSGYSLADSNISITIENTGIYRVQGCLHPKNNGVGNQEASLYSRVLINGVEAKCLQFANSKEFKTTGIDTMPFTGTLYAETGQKVQLQYYVTSTNIDFEGASVFDDGVAGSINFERISK